MGIIFRISSEDGFRSMLEKKMDSQRSNTSLDIDRNRCSRQKKKKREKDLLGVEHWWGFSRESSAIQDRFLLLKKKMLSLESIEPSSIRYSDQNGLSLINSIHQSCQRMKFHFVIVHFQLNGSIPGRSLALSLQLTSMSNSVRHSRSLVHRCSCLSGIAHTMHHEYHRRIQHSPHEYIISDQFIIWTSIEAHLSSLSILLKYHSGRRR